MKKEEKKPSVPDEAAGLVAAEAITDAPLTLDERFELFTYEVLARLDRIEAYGVTSAVMGITNGRINRASRAEIEDVERSLGLLDQPSSESSSDTEATPPVESGTKGE